ncbi:hypothetical protein BGZ83_004385 [Gryganskiella cystojenkinii]|nr:hypothetical protein BGZ83_004385 [Gryganskiella cystojenkinii]
MTKKAAPETPEAATSKSRKQQSSDPTSTNTTVGGANNNIRDSDALAAIQSKLSQFQPKINTMLPRMMEKAATEKATTATTTAAAVAASQRPSKGKKTAEAHTRDKVPLPQEYTSTTKESTSTPSTSTKRPSSSSASKSVATKVPASTTGASSKSVAQSSTPGPGKTSSTSKAAVTKSIADLIPKRSRAKPLVQKTAAQAEPIHAPPPEPARPPQTGRQLSQAIILSSSLPTSPMEEIHIHLDDENGGDGPEGPSAALLERQKSVVSIDSTFKSDDSPVGLPSIEMDKIARWMGGVQEAMQQREEGEANAGEQGFENDKPDNTYTRGAVTTAGLKAAAVTTTDPAKTKSSSITAKSKGTSDASTSTTRRVALRRPPHFSRTGDKNREKSPSVTDDQHSSHPVVHTSQEEAPEEEQEHDEEEEDPMLDPLEALLLNHRRRQPQPRQRQQPAKAVPSKVLAKDSIPSVPPAPLNQDPSDLQSMLARQDSGALQHGGGDDPYGDDDLSTVVGAHKRTQDSYPASSLPSFLYEQGGDEEMVDRLAVKEDEEAYYRRNMLVPDTQEPQGPHKEPEPEPTQDLEPGSTQEPMLKPEPVLEQPEPVQDDPALHSLPSELTASCLQELGLKRKKSGGKHAKKRRPGSNASGGRLVGLQEEEGDNYEEDEGEDEDESPILAQPIIEPSSFGLLASATASPLSHRRYSDKMASHGRSIIRGSGDSDMPASDSFGNDDNSLMLMDEPKYSPLEVPRAAGRRNVYRNGGSGEHQQRDHDQFLYGSSNYTARADGGIRDDPTFPSPPSLNYSFSTLPSMPSLPSFPSPPSLPSMPSIPTLQSEPSVVMLSQFEDETTQSPRRLTPQDRHSRQ